MSFRERPAGRPESYPTETITTCLPLSSIPFLVWELCEIMTSDKDRDIKKNKLPAV